MTGQNAWAYLHVEIVRRAEAKEERAKARAAQASADERADAAARAKERQDQAEKALADAASPGVDNPIAAAAPMLIVHDYTGWTSSSSEEEEEEEEVEPEPEERKELDGPVDPLQHSSGMYLRWDPSDAATAEQGRRAWTAIMETYINTPSLDPATGAPGQQLAMVEFDQGDCAWENSPMVSSAFALIRAAWSPCDNGMAQCTARAAHCFPAILRRLHCSCAHDRWFQALASASQRRSSQTCCAVAATFQRTAAWRHWRSSRSRCRVFFRRPYGSRSRTPARRVWAPQQCS